MNVVMTVFICSPACAKLLILCDLFSRRKGELSREERHEIIKYAKSRLVLKVCHCLILFDLNPSFEMTTDMQSSGFFFT